MAEAMPRASHILFSLGGETRAVLASHVMRVLPSPSLGSVPLMPPGIAGVVAVAGKVIPVIDLPIEEGRELVLASIGGNDYAFRIDKTLRFVAADDAPKAEAQPLDLNNLVQRACWNDLSAEQLLPSLGTTASDLSPAGTSSALPQASALHTAALVVETELSRCLLPLSLILELKETLPIVELPDSSPHLRGAAFYRDDLIPVICLQALLGGERVDPSSWGAFVVVTVEDRLCALAIKRIVGLSRDAEPERFVDLKTLLCAAIPEIHRSQPRLSRESQAPAMETSYLLVRMATQTCAFPIASVIRIHDGCRVVDAPAKSGSAMMGIAAIGGRILPVLDLCGLLGLSATAAKTQFLELTIPQMGEFMVAIDAIIGFATVAQEALLRAPEGSAISAIAKIETKLVWILEPAVVAERAGWSAHAA